MRAVLAIALVLVAGYFVLTAASEGCRFPRFFKHRTKLREIRGFKPEYISTAIGFGKREDPVETPDFGGREDVPSSLPRNSPLGVPAEVLLRAIETDPVLAEKLMWQSTQNIEQDDDRSMMDHSKSARTFALF